MSVVEQDYAGDIEVIVVHDQEEPQTELKELERAGRTITLLNNTHAEGLAGARNTGLDNTTAAYIASCDDDDFWDTDKLRLQMTRMLAEPDLAVLGAGIRLLMGENQVVEWPGDSPVVTRAQLLRSRRKELHSSTLLMRREVFDQIGGYDETLPSSYAEDYEFLLRAVEVGRIGVVNTPLASIRKYNASWFRERAEVVSDALEYVLETHPQIAESRAGHARVLGQIAFAKSTMGAPQGGAADRRQGGSAAGRSHRTRRWPSSMPRRGSTRGCCWPRPGRQVVASPSRRPILVTGVPRSGTTWLARRLAASPHTSMPGREPMNPRGRQFGLRGQLTSWVRREDFSVPEAAVLRRCYQGREPRAFSRYGLRQWAAPLGSTRIIIKDPFAVLSLRAVHDVTGALPVLLYRHPAAVLASYRRMGWTADTEEFTALGGPVPAGEGDLEAMIAMWSWSHEIALKDLDSVPDAVIVSHHALTVGADEAHAALCRRLGLEFSPSVAAQPPPAPSSERREGVLHDFDRSAESVDSGWRSRLNAAEIEHIESSVADLWNELESRQLTLPSHHSGLKDDQT